MTRFAQFRKYYTNETTEGKKKKKSAAASWAVSASQRRKLEKAEAGTRGVKAYSIEAAFRKYTQGPNFVGTVASTALCRLAHPPAGLCVRAFDWRVPTGSRRDDREAITRITHSYTA